MWKVSIINRILGLLLLTMGINLLFLPKASADAGVNSIPQLESASFLSTAAVCCELCATEEEPQEHSDGAYHLCGTCCHGHQHAYLSSEPFIVSVISNQAGMPEEISVIPGFSTNFPRPPRA